MIRVMHDGRTLDQPFLDLCDRPIPGLPAVDRLAAAP
ncbi:hypothetical protein DSM104329_04604 [Capillimicrobium parvum]|uniref:Uncharacterized protein n=1 Tax=Capillimicrobium parvum TaxID=2884022 RepID=A0A9E6Y2E3_9ACTN|nr:hypothetical protein DSM104329_04604 [Capillimicrobium parvum]